MKCPYDRCDGKRYVFEVPVPHLNVQANEYISTWTKARDLLLPLGVDPTYAATVSLCHRFLTWIGPILPKVPLSAFPFLPSYNLHQFEPLTVIPSLASLSSPSDTPLPSTTFNLEEPPHSSLRAFLAAAGAPLPQQHAPAILTELFAVIEGTLGHSLAPGFLFLLVTLPVHLNTSFVMLHEERRRVVNRYIQQMTPLPSSVDDRRQLLLQARQAALTTVPDINKRVYHFVPLSEGSSFNPLSMPPSSCYAHGAALIWLFSLLASRTDASPIPAACNLIDSAILALSPLIPPEDPYFQRQFLQHALANPSLLLSLCPLIAPPLEPYQARYTSNQADNSIASNNLGHDDKENVKSKASSETSYDHQRSVCLTHPCFPRLLDIRVLDTLYQGVKLGPLKQQVFANAMPSTTTDEPFLDLFAHALAYRLPNGLPVPQLVARFEVHK